MSLRTRLHEVIFAADTRASKLFDVALLVAILASVTAICLESVPEIAREHRATLRATEWGFTLLFSCEYLLRLYCVRRPLAYATSFFGLIDLVAVLPLYLGVCATGRPPEAEDLAHRKPSPQPACVGGLHGPVPKDRESRPSTAAAAFAA